MSVIASQKGNWQFETAMTVPTTIPETVILWYHKPSRDVKPQDLLKVRGLQMFNLKK